MATVSAQSTRRSAATVKYAGKGYVAISAVGAPAPLFEQHLLAIREAHGKDGVRPRHLVKDGTVVRDEHGNPVVEKNAFGHVQYESKYVQAYSLVESFGRDELDPEDPESWARAQRYGQALAADRAPGHPVLVATEVNGRTGHVHNHIIIGAVHPVTGKSLDSNAFTHSRMAIAHDRVLAEQGFTQRADMQELTRSAAQEVEQRRAEALQSAPEGISPSQLQRRLIAAENSVRIQDSVSRSGLEPEAKAQLHAQKREDRRQREYELYQLNKIEREAALDVGAVPVPERFSEIELEGRVREVLADPRAQSWDEIQELGRQNGVTIGRRGQDVVYGMMLVEPDGSLSEPARAHRRRGTGLGVGFRVKDVEAAIDKNVALQKAAEAPASTPRSYDDIFRAHEAAIAAGSSASIDGNAAGLPFSEPVVEPTLESEPAPKPFRSTLRNAHFSKARAQRRVAALAQLEEDYESRGFVVDAEFIARLRDKDGVGGIGERSLGAFAPYLHPEMQAVLQQYVEKSALASQYKQKAGRGPAEQEAGRDADEQAEKSKGVAKSLTDYYTTDHPYGTLADFKERQNLTAEQLIASRTADRLRDEIAAGDLSVDAVRIAAAQYPATQARLRAQAVMAGAGDRSIAAVKLPREPLDPQRPHHPRGSRPTEAELVVLVAGEDNKGRVFVDAQVRAEDPLARGQRGLHLRAARSGENQTPTTLVPYTRAEVARMANASGGMGTVIAGQRAFAMRGTVEEVVAGGRRYHRVKPGSVKPSELHPPDETFLETQTAHEDKVRSETKSQGRQLLDDARTARTRITREEMHQASNDSFGLE
ncbi:relaxase/mobilization nuclease domain-containing protein [Leucobacter massiliensis]|uniref:relaxase/mobilization nuclease domain-containing protein n=1 Tax=Leucobacter massiliensis TaxID=1686285 RepID=UPI0015E43B6D|nr:relaxase/mobilization nuclease domain-containing protein [Leucobacter massiliensis]